MLTTIAILALLSVQMIAAAEDPYAKSAETESTEEEKPTPEYYDEVYAVGGKGAYAVTALADTKDWNGEQVANDLYNAKGVTICNNGALDKWGRWKWVYVADAGDDKTPPAVYQYEVKRDAANPGKVELDIDNRQVVYGGPEEEQVAPVDVQCHKKGIAIADAKHGVVFKAEDKVNDKEAAPNKWVAEDCEVVQETKDAHGVNAIAVDGNDVYVAVNAEEGDANNAVWKQEAKANADCADIKKEVADPDQKGAYGVVVKNDKVLFSTGGKVVWDDKGNEWAKGYQQVGYIADAHDRGLIIADKGDNNVYVNNGKGDGAAIYKNVDQLEGVAYYAGLKWEAGAEEEDDSVAALTVGATALAAAAAAQL